VQKLSCLLDSEEWTLTIFFHVFSPLIMTGLDCTP
jgi:hypothetical protein